MRSTAPIPAEARRTAARWLPIARQALAAVDPDRNETRTHIRSENR